MKNKIDIGTLKCVLGLIVLIIIVAIMSSSCYNTKKAIRQTNHALVNYPAVVAKIARTAFPCIVTKSDTLITYTDTTIIVNCPTGNDFEGGDIGINGDVVKHDTLNKHDTISIKRTVKVPFILPVKTITVLKVVEDSAKIELMQTEVNSQDETIVNLEKENAQLSETVKRKNKWILYLWLAVAVSAIGIILKLIIKLK